MNALVNLGCLETLARVDSNTVEERQVFGPMEVSNLLSRCVVMQLPSDDVIDSKCGKIDPFQR